MDEEQWTDRQVRRERKSEQAAGIVMIGWLLLVAAVVIAFLMPGTNG